MINIFAIIMKNKKIFKATNFFMNILYEERLRNKLYIHAVIITIIALSIEVVTFLLQSPKDVLPYFIRLLFIFLFVLIIYIAKSKKIYFIFSFNMAIFCLLVYLWFPSGGIKSITMLFMFMNLIISWLFFSTNKLKIITSTLLHIVAIYFMIFTELYHPEWVTNKFPTTESLLHYWLSEVFIGFIVVIGFLGPLFRESLKYIESKEAEIAEVKKLAQYDPLTSALTRSYIVTLMIAGQNDNHHKYTLAFVDLDKFKLVNDKHGHLIGDELLIIIVAFFKKHLRDGDCVARWGADEFLILFKDTNPNIAYQRMDDIRMKISKEEWTSKKLHITISVGIAEMERNKNIQDIIKKADENLYQSKENGRNRVSML